MKGFFFFIFTLQLFHRLPNRLAEPAALDDLPPLPLKNEPHIGVTNKQLRNKCMTKLGKKKITMYL